MRWISDVWFRLRAVFAPGRMEREMDEEMAFHLEMEARKHVREGMTPEEAALRAHTDFGGVMREKERARDAWGIGLLQDLTSDVRLALRSLRRSPAFAVVVVLSLAVGIGANTALFTKVVEDAVRETPEQWFWVHDRWRIGKGKGRRRRT